MHPRQVSSVVGSAHVAWPTNVDCLIVVEIVTVKFQKERAPLRAPRVASSWSVMLAPCVPPRGWVVWLAGRIFRSFRIRVAMPAKRGEAMILIHMRYRHRAGTRGTLTLAHSKLSMCAMLLDHTHDRHAAVGVVWETPAYPTRAPGPARGRPCRSQYDPEVLLQDAHCFWIRFSARCS